MARGRSEDVAKRSRSKRRQDTAGRTPPPSQPDASPAPRPALGLKTSAQLAIGAGALFFLAATGLSWLRAPNAHRQPAPAVESTFVGSETCSGCHQTEARLWQTSQHRHAMAHARAESVRGDFNDATFDYAGARSRFFRNNGRFFVETDGPDGKLAAFEVKYTFGVDPLQQYLIELPDGRIQALSIAWDTRPKDAGGQRWFHLYPGAAVNSNDPLHWTKPSQNWNFMCAECHSTGVHKSYDPATDRFKTSFAEISVGCEACHGAGSRHVAWARGGKSPDSPDKGLAVRFDERAGVSWTSNPTTLLPRRSAAHALLRKEVETCGLCHARRGQLSEDWKPGHWLSETHRVSLLDRQRFEADGQMRSDEEVYNYAPFKLSRMYAMGVTCSDCHDPHGGSLKAAVDDVCAQCHAATKYGTEAHHHHGAASPSLTCASCHMPVRSYMVVDRRHDHGFRVPRPDLSMQLGVPNACNDCHRDNSPEWAAETITGWFRPQRHGYQTYAGAFAAAWRERPDAQAQLASLASSPDVPALARASALAELPAPDIDLARRVLADPDPMVRLGALDMLESVPVAQLWPLVSPRLSDPVRGVRMRAAELLASLPPAQRPAADNEAFARAAAEFVDAQKLNADRADARATLGNFYARQGNPAGAEAEYRAAIHLDPSFSAAAINLADLYRQLGREGDGERVLREALARSDQDASLHHALGLLLVRQKRLDAALEELQRAVVLDPAQARYAYVYALGLHSAGRRDDATAVLIESLRRHPNDPDALSAMIAFSREKGDLATALAYAERLAGLYPGDRGLAEMIKQLRQ